MSARTGKSTQTDLLILDLRMQGSSYRAIARELNIDAAAVVRRWNRLRDSMIFEKVEEIREMELMVLERMQSAVITDACRGDIDSIDVILRIQNRRAKLCGLDQPIRTEIVITESTPIDEDVKRLVAQLGNEPAITVH